MSDSNRLAWLDLKEESRRLITDKADWMARQLEETIMRDYGIKIVVDWVVVK